MNSAQTRLSNNERDFILLALVSEQRVDGRRPYDIRRLTIDFSRQDGAVEVRQGQTRVMAVVTGNLGPPYQDRPTEGSLAIFTEFSPMADPTFEIGRPGEMAVELGRIIDRGLRESRAVDTESLCVLAGRAVWALRIDIHIMDNGGNLVDVANMAALAALLSYRRPDCTVGGHDGQEIIVHPPEVREPVPLIIHHLPIAVTFAFFSNGDLQVVDPSLKEEAVMGGRLTITVNAQGDVCAIQKGGGIGVRASEIMRCMRIAASKASDITTQLKKAVEANHLERSRRKIKRHTNSTAQDASGCRSDVTREDQEMEEVLLSSVAQDDCRDAIIEMIKEEEMEESSSSESESGDDDDGDASLSNRVEQKKPKLVVEANVGSVSGRNRDGRAQSTQRAGLFEGGALMWDDKKDVKSMRKPARKPFDADALAEFDDIASMITNAARQSNCRVTGDEFLESKSLSRVAAAEVYAQMPEKKARGPRPLGPVFPKQEVGMGGEADEPLVGVEQKSSPASLLDAVKRKKRKKGKNV